MHNYFEIYFDFFFLISKKILIKFVKISIKIVLTEAGR